MMSLNTKVRFTSLIVLLVLMVQTVGTPHAAPAAPWQATVDPWVLTKASAGETEFIVFLAEQADLSQARQLTTKLEKGTYVFEQLTEVARRSQMPVLAALESRAAEYRPYWIANMIWARGDLRMVEIMAQRADVAHIYANPWVRLDGPVEPATPLPPHAVEAIEWNIDKVRAPQVWAAGYTGQGAVIGGQDTGYEWDHPALKDQYRGWDGISADHNFNWHDAIHESFGNPCGSDTSQPCDDHGHGTHTMGTMLGDDPSHSHQIGMAPGAQWIGCRNMDQGFGSPITYSECYQWFLAPTDLNDENPDPSRAPDVINNSWSCPIYEGCTDPNVLLSAVEAVRAAGILTVHSAGNSGPECSTVDTPAAIYDASFTVGATTEADSVADFSSRGPVTLDGSGRLKPDISAPGTNIYSSYPGGDYTWLSGTSMAGPHVAGLVALLISAQPDLRGQVDGIEKLIEYSAVPLISSQNCGGVDGAHVPNNTSGWGRIDTWAAFQGHVLSLGKVASAERVPTGSSITYTLTVTHTATLASTTDVVLTDVIPENTTFASASEPYSFDGSAVEWKFPSLAPNESQVVQLTVQVPLGFTGTIVNDQYQVASAEVTTPVKGDPVSIIVGEMYFLPIAIR